MSFSFLYPSISSLPCGYDSTIVIPTWVIAQRLKDGMGHVNCEVKVLHEGNVEFERKIPLEYAGGKLISQEPEPIIWRDAGNRWHDTPGFLELSFVAGNDAPIFRTNRVAGFYTIYSKTGKKSFFSDNAYKYGSPPVIAQIAEFGAFIDGYPLIHLDRKKDLGETITLINPYKRPIIATIKTQDGRTLPRTRIPPSSARNVLLSQLLQEDEDSWIGQIQLTANNRVITYNIKHSLSDSNLISDHEHLDPFRSDPTHQPATVALRIHLAGFLGKCGRAIRRRKPVRS